MICLQDFGMRLFCFADDGHNLMFVSLLFLSGARPTVTLQDKLTLTPTFSKVLENTSLELTCDAPANTTYTQWGTLNRPDKFSSLFFSEGESCITHGFLKDSIYFETKCFRNATFKVIIRHVNISNHGQEWYCSNNFLHSNSSYISVQVPTKYVRIRYIDGDVIKTVEQMETSLTCETSYGLPAANITWMKETKAFNKTDVAHDMTYNASIQETLSENNMIKVRSSIDIVPLRDDNDTRIVCQATNMKSSIVEKEILLIVQYPPSKPVFVVDDIKVNCSLRVISGNGVSVLCKSDSYPSPTYLWTSTRRSEYSGQYLNISSLDRSDTWQCTTTNNMTLPNGTTMVGTSSETLKIQLLYPPSRPVLTTEEGNHTVNETWYAIRNDDVKIMCLSDGYPAPHYMWFGHDMGARLHIASIQENTNETCIASNRMRETLGKEQNSSSNTTFEIVVSYPPGKPYLQFTGLNELAKNGTFLTNKVILKETSAFNVTCKADGYPSPVCTWNVNNALLSSTLSFTNISKRTKGLYRCFAENVIKRSFPVYEVQKITLTDLEIDVLYQSRIERFYTTGLKQKEGVFEVTENDTILFNCTVDSNPESSIVLSFKGKELGHDFSAKTLIHTHRVRSCFDDGIYKCAAQNSYNDKPSVKELELVVRCKPIVSSEFKLNSTIATKHNITVTFEFKVFATPVPVFNWFKKSGTAWNKLSTTYKYKIHSVEHYSNLSVISIDHDDYGTYKLEVRNEIGSLQQLYVLKETVATSKLHFMLSKKGFEGNKFKVKTNEEISFMCLSDSDLSSDITISKQDGERISLTKNTTFVRHTVYKVSCDDAGEYRCSARNIVTLQPEVVSKLILIVKCPPLPAVKIKADNTFAALHSDVTLHFEAYEYFDEPNNTVFMWYKRNISLTNDGRKYIITDYGFQSNLVIRNIIESDFGLYKVLVRNLYGQYINIFELQEKVFPTKEVNFLGSTTALILLVAVGTLCFIIVAVILGFIGCIYIRRRRNKRQITAVVVENETTPTNDENDELDDEVIHIYDQIDEQLTEGACYMEMRSITSEDSNKYYITPTN